MYSVEVTWFLRCVAAGCGAMLCGLLGCGEPGAPPLLEVTSLSPRSIEAGDAVEITGAGFPEGKTATVTLSGSLYRAGLPSITDYQATFAARGESRNELLFQVGDEIEEALQEGEKHSSHATFRGTAMVAFAPKIAGAPPILGELPQLTLEFFSARAATDEEAASREAQRLSELLGMTVEPSERGLRIAAVVPGRAHRAGIMAGDTLVSANGVSVFKPADLLPPIQERQVVLNVKRSHAVEPLPIRLSIDGFSPLLPTSFSWIFASIFALTVWTALLFSTLRVKDLTIIWWRINANMGPRRDRAVTIALLVGALALALFTRPTVPWALRFGIVLPLLAVAFLRPLLGFMAHGRHSSTGFPLARATSSALKIQAVELCALVLLWPVVLHSGGLGISELRMTQGAMPWQWLMFRSIPAFAAGSLFLLTALYDAPGAQDGPSPYRTDRVKGSMFLSSCDSALVMIKCALFVTLFLGGTLYPFQPAGSGIAATLLAALVYVSKYTLVALLVLRLRARFGYPKLEEVSRPIALVVGAAVVCAGSLALPQLGEPMLLLGWLKGVLAPVLCMITLFGLLLVLGAKRSRTPRSATVNPWL